MKTLTARVAAALIAIPMLSMAGCAGSGRGLDANGQPLQPGSGGAGPLTADFDSIQAHVFTPICTVCHIGAGAPHGLRLDAADSYNLLVGVPSDEVPGVLRVKPGDPSNSYVIQKLEGHAAVGERMPLGGPYLSADVIGVIRQWITDGAMRSATAAVASAQFIVNGVAPAPDELLPSSPPQIMVGFNRELDLTRIDAESARIERFAPDDGAPSQAVPVRIAVPDVNRRALLLWPQRPLTPGRYRVVLRTNSGPVITDAGGTAVQAPPRDPSDGGAGDATVTVFDVEGTP